MIAWLPKLVESRAVRLRAMLLLLFATIAIVGGFRLMPGGTAERVIAGAGYYYILALFACWLYFARRVLPPRGFIRNHWKDVGIIAGLTAFSILTDQFAQKVLFDEYVLQGTAWHMHATKEIGTPVRAYDFAGTWMAVDTFLDKRPYFFPFLLSLLHDLTGFRLGNVFILNGVLAAVTLASVYWLVLALTDRRAAAVLATTALATLPLFGQNATGGSMEMLNLAMIGVVLVSAVHYLRAPDEDRLSFLIFGTVLLSQARYESVLFVLPVAVIALIGWQRVNRVILSWPAIIAPLLLMPYAWHERYVATKPVLWQLREGEEARFALRYLSGNIEAARRYFFSATPVQSNSLWLTIVGVGGLLWIVMEVVRSKRGPGREPANPAVPVLAWFGAVIAANLGLLMFYYWSRLDEPIAARFALPSFFLLAVISGWFVHRISARWVPAIKVASMSLGLWMLVIAFPAYAHRFYTSLNLVMHETRWELESALRKRGAVLWITAKATMPFLLERVPSVNTKVAATRAGRIAWHLRHGTFRDVFVSQVLRPTSERGDMIVDPEDVLPANFVLRTVDEKRFGARYIRISRLERITDSEERQDGKSDADARAK